MTREVKRDQIAVALLVPEDHDVSVVDPAPRIRSRSNHQRGQVMHRGPANHRELPDEPASAIWRVLPGPGPVLPDLAAEREPIRLSAEDQVSDVAALEAGVLEARQISLVARMDDVARGANPETCAGVDRASGTRPGLTPGPPHRTEAPVAASPLAESRLCGPDAGKQMPEETRSPLPDRNLGGPCSRLLQQVLGRHASLLARDHDDVRRSRNRAGHVEPFAAIHEPIQILPVPIDPQIGARLS